MALPNSVNSTVPAGADLPSTIDNRIRNLALAVEDIFGVPDQTNISLAAMAVSTNGASRTVYVDTAVNPATNGHFQRNGSTMVLYDGTAARTFATNANTLTMSNKTLDSPVVSGNLDYNPAGTAGTPSTTGAWLDVGAATFNDNATANLGTATAFAAHAIQRPGLTAANTVTTTDATTLYIRHAPGAGSGQTIANPWSIWVDDGHVRLDGDLRVDGVLRGSAALGYHIQGLVTSSNASDLTNDIDITIGQAVSDDTAQSSRRMMTLTSALTKQSEAAWAVGTNAGMLDTGAVGNSDYYIWLIMRSDTGVVDALSSLSATAPNMPPGYDFRRKIGWFKRVSATVVSFNSYETSGGGLEYLWINPTLDVDLASTLTTARRTDAVKVPLDFSTVAHLNIIVNDGATDPFTWVSSPDHVDMAPSSTAAPLFNLMDKSSTIAAASQRHIRTSATGTIAARSLTTVDIYRISTMGFHWARRN